MPFNSPRGSMRAAGICARGSKVYLPLCPFLPFYLSGDELRECGTCQCPLTVKHILVDCVDLKDVRNKHFVASSIKDLFDSIEAHKIIDFIKETRFYKQL